MHSKGPQTSTTKRLTVVLLLLAIVSCSKGKGEPEMVEPGFVRLTDVAQLDEHVGDRVEIHGVALNYKDTAAVRSEFYSFPMLDMSGWPVGYGRESKRVVVRGRLVKKPGQTASETKRFAEKYSGGPVQMRGPHHPYFALEDTRWCLAD